VHVPRRSWKLAFVSGFWASPPDPTGSLPLNPAEGLSSPDPSVVLRSKFLATPLGTEDVASEGLKIDFSTTPLSFDGPGPLAREPHEYPHKTKVIGLHIRR